MAKKKLATLAKRKREKEKEDDKSWLIEDAWDDDDEDEPQSDEDKEREKHEAKVLREMEYNERGRLHDIVLAEGGIRTSDALREEYRQIPNTYKRRDGMAGDDMAAILAESHPEFGIESENDLLDFFAYDNRRAA